METRSGAWALGVAGIVVLVGCGGGGAKSPSTCPDGTVLKGSDCVPDDSSSSSGDDSSSGSSGSSGAGSSAGGSSGGGAGAGGADSSGATTPYDKEAVEVQLKRAARQVKGHCGGATDDSGAATGPWGETKASVTLGRNGHVKQVTVPSPYDGKPVGLCVIHAFEKLIFPPYPGSADVTVDWDIELVQPKGK